MILQINDRVKMHTCGEASFEQNINRVWIVKSKVFNLCGTDCVTIISSDEDQKRYASFATEFLKKTS